MKARDWILTAALAGPLGMAAALSAALPPNSAAESPAAVVAEPFTLVALDGGGTLTLRHGPTHLVRFVAGGSRYARVDVVGGSLRVESCRHDCPAGYELEAEIEAPEIAGVRVSNGGVVQLGGPFPATTQLVVEVDQGGTVDVRSLPADRVEASVRDGGVILTRPRVELLGSVTRGGHIAYWGDAKVRSSIRDGGVVFPGATADFDKPLPELNWSLDLPPIPPLPPLPPVPPVPRMAPRPPMPPVPPVPPAPPVRPRPDRGEPR